MAGFFIKAAVAAQYDQQDMPCKGMDGQRRIVVMHSAGIKKNKDTSQQSEIHQESCQKGAEPVSMGF